MIFTHNSYEVLLLVLVYDWLFSCSPLSKVSKTLVNPSPALFSILVILVNFPSRLYYFTIFVYVLLPNFFTLLD